MTQEKNRQSNFELLRIFAMILIIWNHSCMHGIWLSKDVPISFNVIISKGLCIWPGILGDYLFILLSGYFVSSSKFSWKKVFKLWLQVFFISATIGVIFFIFKIRTVSANVDMIGFYEGVGGGQLYCSYFTKIDLIKSLMPILFGNNWFASAYLVFYLFTPFLNESIKILNIRMHKYLIILMILIGTVIYMIPGQGLFQSNNLYYFVLGFYIANYIKIYNPKILQNQKINISVSLSLSIFFIIWMILCFKFRNSVSYINTHFIHIATYPFASIARFPILLNSIFVFSLFKNLSIKNNKRINLIAGTTFGIYLIHENPYFRNVLWHRIFRFDELLESKILLLYMIFAVIVVFCICSLLDFFRKIFFEKIVFNFIRKHK